MNFCKSVVAWIGSQVKGRFNTKGKPFIVWEYLFMSAVMAGFLATQIKFGGTQTYTQLVVGDLAVELGSKTGDYQIPLLALIYGIGIYLGIIWLVQTLQHRSDAEMGDSFRQMGAYALIPAGLWLGTQFVDGNSLILIWMSVVLILTLVICATITAIMGVHFRGDRHFATALTASMLIPILAPINVIAAFLLKRMLDPINPPSHNAIETGIYISLGVGVLLTLSLWLSYCRQSLRLQHRLMYVLLWAQGLIPLLFLVLIPLPWITEAGVNVGFTVTPPILALVGILLVWAYGDLVWQGYQLFQARLNQPMLRLSLPISIPVILAILLFIKTAVLNSPVLSTDDYHFGEFLLPWWLWSDFGQLPFQDYFPARGLVNYVPGLFADVFFNGTAAAINTILGRAILALPYLALGLILIQRSIGLLPTFLGLLLLPAPNGLFEIYLILTASLCLLAEFFQHRRWVQWLALWGGISIVLVLFAPGQGGLFVLGTMPLGMMALYNAFRHSPAQIARWFGGFVAILVVLALVTPLDQMLFGAIMYGAEQSSTNTIAYGILWERSQGSNPSFGYPLWELLRTAWLWVGGIAAILLYRIAGDRSWFDRQRYITYAIPIVLYTILWIPRAAGRIDPGSASRLGIASIWFVSLLLPIVLLIAFGKRYQAQLLVVIAMIAGLVVSIAPTSIAMLDKTLTYPAATTTVRTEDLMQSQTLELANLGTVKITPEHAHHLLIMKTVLGTLIDSGETYLDLTSRNAQYFYLNYPVPIEAGAVYNLVHINQQQRAIQTLAKDPPPVVLASENVMGFSSALRSHLVYRYVLTQYIPVQIETYIFMVRPDRLPRLNADFLVTNGLQETPPILATYVGEPNSLTLNEDGKTLVDQAFLTPDLLSIPSAWGHSWDTLLPELELIETVNVNALAITQDLTSVAPNQYQVTGAQPRLRIDLSPLDIVGDQAGLLTFDFVCDAGDDTTVVGLAWHQSSADPATTTPPTVQFKAHNGKQIVPLDSAPRWLLADQVQSLEFAILDPADCSTFTLTNLELRQRRSVNEIERLVTVD